MCKANSCPNCTCASKNAEKTVTIELAGIQGVTITVEKDHPREPRAVTFGKATRRFGF